MCSTRGSAAVATPGRGPSYLLLAVGGLLLYGGARAPGAAGPGQKVQDSEVGSDNGYKISHLREKTFDTRRTPHMMSQSVNRIINNRNTPIILGGQSIGFVNIGGYVHNWGGSTK